MTFLGALIPVMFMVSLGQFLAWRQIPPREGWRSIERLCYMALVPALIILVLSRAPLQDAPWKIALTLVVSQIILAAIGLTSQLWPGIDRPSVGSIVQSNSRWNTFIALTISGVLYGDNGLAITAICAAIMIPMANILSILALSHFGHNETGIKRNPFAELIRNPLVIACIIGAFLNFANLKPTGLFETILTLVSNPAMSLGLLAAGAGVNFLALRRAGLLTVFWSLVRLIGMPIVAGLIGRYIMGIEGEALAIILIATATPTATNGYILARQLGGNADLMANLIASQTLLSALTIPFSLWMFGLLPA
ncbi:AEC family transporter [Ponticaulis sp.]|uniref:AEC family transporter n=1 Tax=Ponticaulis sp. TaxID=2020902 RepID=UPI000B739619|nr:AEC family transporter [Ponticaulis sp.]MAI91967.1 auxin efflux carrier family protein [Ponticaulis sp.]OUX96438.1 MAG: auxin efflux carrier family protein [Hyphomonadaceae bacterium TMED5]|tara:strand:- start:44588 stop:45511 length:924 start_codon:yes stop_codon:yes gene_type:complete